jgi:NAD(P)-dependent dehydrogenase (short-subunit alcohol dehydrogenase family)
MYKAPFDKNLLSDGESIALRFAEEGADVGLIDVNEQGLKETAERVQALSQKAVVCKCDMSEVSDIDAAVKVFIMEFKKIDILVNGAGIGDTNAGYDDLTPEI